LAGLVGSLMGLGGGLIAVPFLNLLLGVPMHQAAAAGLISTLAVSCGAAGRYLRRGGLIEVNQALELELAAAGGGLAGGYLVGFLGGSLLQVLFAAVLVYSGIQIFRTVFRGDRPADPTLGGGVWRLRLAMGLCLLAGVLSGLLGIGGGLVVVPVLHLVLRLPFKNSTATSNFMMGLTAVPALCGYIARGDLDLGLAGPLAAGVLVGASLGAWLMPRIGTRWLKLGFSLVLLGTAIEMARKGISSW
jgi:uncharacterized membrane protein YfcA